MKRLFIPPVFVLISFLLIVIFYFWIPEYNWIPFPINLSGIIVIIRVFFIPTEEKLMVEAFGQEYLDYKKKVRRWI